MDPTTRRRSWTPPVSTDGGVEVADWSQGGLDDQLVTAQAEAVLAAAA